MSYYLIDADHGHDPSYIIIARTKHHTMYVGPFDTAEEAETYIWRRNNWGRDRDFTIVPVLKPLSRAVEGSPRAKS